MLGLCEFGRDLMVEMKSRGMVLFLLSLLLLRSSEESALIGLVCNRLDQALCVQPPWLTRIFPLERKGSVTFVLEQWCNICGDSSLSGGHIRADANATTTTMGARRRARFEGHENLVD